MKLIGNDENEMVMGNSSSKTTFSISAGAKAFKILSSNIYKNKIRAVVRELVCNAVDAHVLNSQTKPYTIKPPTGIDPRFIVRDYGPGLDENDMIELYTTYFASSKAERNDQIGAFGLGSKSPFSYTNTFSVISYHEGVVRSFQCNLTNGEPSITKTYEGEFENGDESGIEVIVPTKLDDQSSWISEIQYVMRPFKVGSYEIKGISDLGIEPFENLQSYNDDFFVLKNARLRGLTHKGMYAIYGNILYPIDDVPNLNADWLRSYNGNIFIHFDLGLLDIQPSREELSLDETTIANIQKRVDECNKKMLEETCNHLKSFTKIRELKRNVYKLPGTQLAILEKNNFQINGIDIAKITAGENLLKLLKDIENTSTRIVESYCSKISYRKPFVRSTGYRKSKVSEVELSNVVGYKKEKAFVFIVDDKKPVNKSLMGLYLSKDPNTPDISSDYIFVCLNDEKYTKPFFDELKTVMVDDEIVIFKSSECEEYRKLVPGYGVKIPRPKPEEIRPKQPNGVKIEYDKNLNIYVSKDLYMSPKEIREIDGYVVLKYRDDYRALSSSQPLLKNLDSDDFKATMRKNNVNELYVLRPQTWDKIQSKKCFFEDFYIKPFLELFKKTNPDDYYVGVDGNRFLSNITKHKCLEPILKKIVKSGFDGKELFERYEQLSVCVRTGVYDELDDAIKFMETKISSIKTDINAKIIEFSKEYLIFHNYLDRFWYVSDEVALQISEQYNILCANQP